MYRLPLETPDLVRESYVRVCNICVASNELARRALAEVGLTPEHMRLLTPDEVIKNAHLLNPPTTADKVETALFAYGFAQSLDRAVGEIYAYAREKGIKLHPNNPYDIILNKIM